MKTTKIILAIVTSIWSTMTLAEPVTVYFELGDPAATGTVQTISVQAISTQAVTTQDDHLIPNRLMPPSVITSKINKGEQTIEFNAICTLFYTPLQNCDIVFDEPLPEPFSGGHDHDDTSRPGGTVDPMVGNTGDYALLVKYTAPEISGFINLWGTATHPQLFGSVRNNFIIKVAVPGLVDLPTSTNYDLVGQFGTTSPNGNTVTSAHNNNHYGTPSVNASVVRLANDYRFNVPNDKLKINDISLKWGGLFDAENNDWGPAHTNHRFGRNVDISTVGVRNRILFKFLASTAGFTYMSIYKSHYHISR